MRVPFLVLLVAVLSFAAGWLLRDLTFTEALERASAPRRTEPRPTPAAPSIETTAAREAAPPAELPSTPGEPEDAVDADVDEAGLPPEFAEAMRAQAPQTKAWSRMQTEQKLKGRFAALGFDPATADQIDGVLLAEVERQVDRAYDMFVGEADIEADAFYWFMGFGPELSTEAERDLARFLNDAEIAVVREDVKRAHREQVQQMSEMVVSMMGIQDLTDGQRASVREVFTDKDVMVEQWTGFAEAMRNPKEARSLVQGDGLAKAMEKDLAGQRERMRVILSPAQFDKYMVFEQNQIKQAEFWLKMMFGQKKEK